MRIRHLIRHLMAFTPVFWVTSIVAQHAPKVWNEADLADWVTPVVGLNARPTHLSEKDYYALPVENLRTYPVYYPGREPAGYWDMLQRIGPKPLIEPEGLKSEADWIAAGRRVFDELDHLPLRTFDPKFIAAARSAGTFDSKLTEPLTDGTIFGARWVPTAKGVALSFSNCANCHLLYMKDGTRLPGAPTFAGQRTTPAKLVLAVHPANRVATASAPFRMGAEPFGMWLYRAYGVPWAKDDLNEQLKEMTMGDFSRYSLATVRGGAPPRWNGSVFFPAKLPDLIGIKNRKYLDATGTHLHRGIGDLMRYAAQVSSAEISDFGPYHILSSDAQRNQGRASDEALYALALYIYSLEPPHNPDPFGQEAKAGQEIFGAKVAPAAMRPRFTRTTSSR